MSRREIQRTWERLVRKWRDAKVPYKYPGGDDPGVGLDCWHGGFLLLYAEVGIDIPNPVASDFHADANKAKIADYWEPFYANHFHSLGYQSTRVRTGDVLFFRYRSRSHVATCISEGQAVHVTEHGIILPFVDQLFRSNRVRSYRYNGSGHEIFDVA